MSKNTTGSELNDFPPLGFKGAAVRPGDASYPEVRKTWTSRYDHQTPQLIAQCTDVDDVVLAVRYAREKDIPIAIRSGGHGIDGYAMADGAFVIDMSLLKGIEVDPETGRVRAEAGVLLGELDAATQEHGLAVPVGTATTTGVTGLLLGGGIGYLTPRFGATVDNLLSIDVVTVDGRQLTASRDEHAGLFWGLKGAGHNLAIVTSFELQAHPVGPDVVSGFIIYPADATLKFLAGLDEAVSQTPRELITYAILTHCPPFPGLPATIIGSPVFVLLLVYTGPIDDFKRAAAPILKLGDAPLADLTAPQSWLTTQAMMDAIATPGRRANSRGSYLPHLTREIAEIAIERIGQCPPPPPGGSSWLIEFCQIGGALHDFDEDSAAFSRADANWFWVAGGLWDSPNDDTMFEEWVASVENDILPHGLRTSYVNLAQARDSTWLTRVYGSPEKWQRICQLKEEWDPNNVLRHNKNVFYAERARTEGCTGATDTVVAPAGTAFD